MKMNVAPTIPVVTEARSARKAGASFADEDAQSTLDLFLNRIGRRPLLTREGEIDLARRIEEGERAILEALVKSRTALREFGAVGAEIRAKKLRPKDLLRDADEDPAAGAKRTARLAVALERAGALARSGKPARSGAPARSGTLARSGAPARSGTPARSRALARSGRTAGRTRTEEEASQSAARAAERREVLAELENARLHRRVLERVIDAVREAASSSDGGTRGGMTKTLASIERGIRIADAAKAELVESNLRLVILFAKRHMNQGLPLLDLIQEGNIGLLRAVDKFDHRRAVRFSTYASWWVKQQMSRALADQGKIIRVPVHMVESRRKLVRAKRRFAQEHGRDPDELELAEETGLGREKVRAVNELVPEPISLEAPSGAEGEATVGDFVADTRAQSPDEGIAETRMRAGARELLKGLSPREQEVLRMRFGLDGGEEHTLQQIGVVLHVSRERVRQIEAEALRKLQTPSKAGSLETYIAA